MMKDKLLSLIVVISLLVGGISLSAQDGSFFKSVDIKTSFADAPVYSTKNYSETIPRGLRWIMIEVEYIPAARVNKDGNNEWIDDVTMEYEVLLPANKDGSAFTYLSGQIEYWSIPMDGEKHQATAFVPPRFVQRYAPELRGSRRDLQNLYVKMSIKVNGALVGGGFYVPRGKNMREVATIFEKAARSTKLVRVKDSVFGRDKTPWAMLNPDSYELIKQHSR